MDDATRTDRDADAINDRMVREMEQRRRERQDRRVRQEQTPDVRCSAGNRRRLCSYCFQPGDHPTAAHCLRALERR